MASWRRGGRGHPHFLGTRKWVAPSAPFQMGVGIHTQNTDLAVTVVDLDDLLQIRRDLVAPAAPDSNRPIGHANLQHATPG